MGTEFWWDGVLHSQFTPLLSKVNKIPRDLAKRIDEIVQSASSPNPAATDINLNELPDLETISKKHIPTLRFIPVKCRVRWSELLTSVIDVCILHAQLLENWKKLFAISKCVLRASSRGGKKHKQQQETVVEQTWAMEIRWLCCTVVRGGLNEAVKKN